MLILSRHRLNRNSQRLGNSLRSADGALFHRRREPIGAARRGGHGRLGRHAGVLFAHRVGGGGDARGTDVLVRRGIEVRVGARVAVVALVALGHRDGDDAGRELVRRGGGGDGGGGFGCAAVCDGDFAIGEALRGGSCFCGCVRSGEEEKAAHSVWFAWKCMW